LNLSLDYDDTYTRDPSAWDEFIELMRRKGHKVYLVTWRKPGESAEVYLQLQNKVDAKKKKYKHKKKEIKECSPTKMNWRLLMSCFMCCKCS